MPLSTKTRFVEIGLTIDPYQLEFTEQNRSVFIAIIMKVFSMQHKALLCSLSFFDAIHKNIPKCHNVYECLLFNSRYLI